MNRIHRIMALSMVIRTLLYPLPTFPPPTPPRHPFSSSMLTTPSQRDTRGGFPRSRRKSAVTHVMSWIQRFQTKKERERERKREREREREIER